MKIHIGAIGRLKKGPEQTLADQYFERIEKTGRQAGITALKIAEYPESTAASADLRKADEAARLLASCPSNATILVLDEHGKDQTSAAFAQTIARFRDDGKQDLAFLIGGPDGHDHQLLKNCHVKIALGARTWPHRLVRIMLAEQIYRAVTIMLNHPYHRS